jgi:hypothetical protein
MRRNTTTSVCGRELLLDLLGGFDQVNAAVGVLLLQLLVYAALSYY